MIDFNSIPYQEIAHFQDGEGIFRVKMVDDGQNRILCGRLEPGCSIGLHRHETSAEILFVIAGHGIVTLEGVEEPLGPGQCHYCKKGCAHTLRCEGEEPLCFYAVVPQQ